VDKDGNRVWEKTFGGKDWGYAYSVIESREGGYLIAGGTESKGAGGYDAWLIRVDKDGNRVWEKTFGGKDSNRAYSVIESREGGYLIAGGTESKGAGKADAWLIRVDSNGMLK
jgi:predicted secreted protein